MGELFRIIVAMFGLARWVVGGLAPPDLPAGRARRDHGDVRWHVNNVSICLHGSRRPGWSAAGSWSIGAAAGARRISEGTRIPRASPVLGANRAAGQAMFRDWCGRMAL
jgi:hypothetical protein